MTRYHRGFFASTSALMLAASCSSFAQGLTTADIFGEVVDVSTKQPVADAIVVATSPSLQGEQTEITDRQGRYRISNVPPGNYTITVTAPGYKEFKQSDITVLVGRNVKVRVNLLPEVFQGEEIKVTQQVASVIDQGSTTTGQTFTKDYMEHIAVQRNMLDITESTPGAQYDQYGVAFNGTSSPEAAIYIDGVNTVDTGTGIRTSNLPLEFLEQVQVMTGGYMPEFGNATGGIVNAITKIGGNEFHGSVFSYTTPFQLRTKWVGQAGEAISHRLGLSYQENIGFELGGPILKDKLWFHVGFAPSFAQYTLTERFNARVDDGTGQPKLDARGIPVTTAIPGSDRTFKTTERAYVFTSKLTYNPGPNHRITVGFSGNPTFRNGVQASYIGINNLATLNGDPSAFDAKTRSGGTDLIANYDGKFFNQRFLVNALLGWHRAINRLTPATDIGANKVSVQWTGEEDLTRFMPTLAPYCSNFTNPAASDPRRCPVSNYLQNGYGYYDYQRQDRLQLRLSGTFLFSFLGSHQLKAGVEIQRSSLYHTSQFSGGATEQVVNNDTQFYDSQRYGYGNPRANQIAGGQASSDPYVLDDANNTFFDSYRNTTYYINYAPYIQDSWNLFDRVTLAGGVRIDHQEPHGGDGSIPFRTTNVSPRIGIIYDFTGTGRSKLYASYGRFTELLPLSLLDRAFPHQSQITTLRTFTGTGGCGPDNPLVCPAVQRNYIRSVPEGILKPITGQTVEAYEAGFEYQLLSDLLAGIKYTRMREITLIEDWSNNGGANFYAGDFGSYPTTNTLIATNPVTGLKFLYYFKHPERNYDAITVYVNKALGHHFLGNVSYTLSFLRGVEGGLYRTEDNELHPNNNNTFNSASLLPNVYGYLGADHRHMFKVDGAYLFEVTRRWLLVPNIRFRVESGAAYSLTAADPNFGPLQAYILSRGLGGRTDWIYNLDLGVKAEYVFHDGYRLSIGFTILNLLNGQFGTHADERYAYNDQYIRPIAGGTPADLQYVKTFNQTPPKLNPNFGQITDRWAPLSGRLDIKLSF